MNHFLNFFFSQNLSTSGHQVTQSLDRDCPFFTLIKFFKSVHNFLFRNWLFLVFGEYTKELRIVHTSSIVWICLALDYFHLGFSWSLAKRTDDDGHLIERDHSAACFIKQRKGFFYLSYLLDA